MFISYSLSISSWKKGKKRFVKKKKKKIIIFVQNNVISYDTGTKKFVETFCAYQQEMWALGPKHKDEPTNDEEAEQAIKERFERSQQILDLREKYYAEYSKFLTPLQIQRVYKMERQVGDHLKQHRGQGKPQVPRKPHSPHFEPEELER